MTARRWRRQARGRRRRRSGWRPGLGDGVGLVEAITAAPRRRRRTWPTVRASDAEAAELADHDAPAGDGCGARGAAARARARRRRRAGAARGSLQALEGADRVAAAHAVGRQAAVALEVVERARGAGTEDAVDPAGVEAEAAEPRCSSATSSPAGWETVGRAAGRRASSCLDQCGPVCSSQTPSARRPRAAWKARTAASVDAAVAARLGARGGWEPGGTEAALQIADGLAVLDRASAGPVGRNSSSSWSSWPLPLAPTRRLRTSPSLKTSSVGMLITSKRRAMSGLSSTLSLAIVRFAGLLGGDLARGWGRSSCTGRTTRPRSRRAPACRPRRPSRRRWTW